MLHAHRRIELTRHSNASYVSFIDMVKHDDIRTETHDDERKISFQLALSTQ